MRSIHQRRADAVREAMTDANETMGAPGIVWAVASGPTEDRVVTVESAGPLQPDALFRIASVTKPIAAAAVMRLVADGVLGMDEPLERWVPEWADRRVVRTRNGPLDDTVAASRPLTVRDLLAMGFGLGYDTSAPEDDPLTRASLEADIYSSWVTPSLSPDEWSRRAGSLPMAHQPGEGYLYQASFDALTVVVERATGRDFDEVVREQILIPTGMTETGYTVPTAELHRVPANLFPSDDGFTEAAPAGESELQERPLFCSGATGLISSVSDMIRFAQMLLDGGVGPNGAVLPAKSVEQIYTEAISPVAKEMAAAFLEPGQTWGLGVAIDDEGRFGWDGGTGTGLWIDPRAQTAGVLLTREGMGGPSMPEYMTRFWAALRSVSDVRPASGGSVVDFRP